MRKIGQRNSIREGAIIYGGISTPTRLGDDNLIMACCVIEDGATVSDRIVTANNSVIEKGVAVGSDVILSGGAWVDEGGGNCLPPCGFRVTRVPPPG